MRRIASKRVQRQPQRKRRGTPPGARRGAYRRSRESLEKQWRVLAFVAGRLTPAQATAFLSQILPGSPVRSPVSLSWIALAYEWKREYGEGVRPQTLEQRFKRARGYQELQPYWDFLLCYSVWAGLMVACYAVDSADALAETGRKWPGLRRTPLSKLGGLVKQLMRLGAGRKPVPAVERVDLAEELLEEPLFSLYSRRPGGQLGDGPTTLQRLRRRLTRMSQTADSVGSAEHPLLPMLPADEHLHLLQMLLKGQLPPLDSLPEDFRGVPPKPPAEALAALADIGSRLVTASTSRLFDRQAKQPHDRGSGERQ